jgi:hypothetical protein
MTDCELCGRPLDDAETPLCDRCLAEELDALQRTYNIDPTMSRLSTEWAGA